MQVTELRNEGLQREYKVVVAAESIAEQVSSRLDNIAQTAQMPGFRKGKVPLHILQKRYGIELLQDILRETVDNTSKQIFSERNIRPAVTPDINIGAFNEGSSFEYTISVEIFPDVTLPDFSKVKLNKLVADISAADIDERLTKFAGFYKDFTAPATPRPAALGDVVVIDFEGSIDGVPFEGGQSENFRLELGSGQFIPGFEEQLVGSTVGAKLNVNVSFPEAYHHAPLAGKAAVFAVTIHEILEGSIPEITEEFAKKFNFDTVDALKDAIRTQIEKEAESVSRTKMKKELFDALETLITFPVPSKMVDLEFNHLWETAKQEENGLDASKSEEEQQQEYRKIADRRVKLGILLAETAKSQNLNVSQEEIKDAIYAQARSYPGQEHMVVDYFRKNAGALEQLKGPILEDKSVDYILSLATVTDTKTAVTELMQALDNVA